MRPMLATPGDLPTGTGWAYEVKWDGVRAVVTVGDGRVDVRSRAGGDLTGSFPELAGLAAALAPHRAVLDGEVVAFDERGVPHLSALAPRLHRRGGGSGAGAGAGVRPVTYVVFDLLALDGEDLTGRPWRERRQRLEALLASGPAWQVPQAFDDGPGLLAATAARGLEGVVAKRREAPYQPGRRSPDWVKVPHRRTRSFVVGGWKAGTAPGPGRIGSLLVGTPAGDGRLVYDGAVGSGLSAALQRTLRAVLDDLTVAAAPFDPPPGGRLPDPQRDGITWCDPILVVDVEHLGRAGQGMLRQPVLVRARPDLTYDDLLDEEG